MGLFSPSGASPIVGTTTIAGKRTPTVQNLTMATAGTEYSFTIPASSVACKFKARNNSTLQYAYTMGQSNVEYITLWPGEEETIDLMDASNGAIQVYVQASKDNEVIEIVSWV